MGATNHPGDTSTNLGDKLNSLIEPALTDLGTKIPVRYDRASDGQPRGARRKSAEVDLR